MLYEARWYFVLLQRSPGTFSQHKTTATVSEVHSQLLITANINPVNSLLDNAIAPCHDKHVDQVQK